MFEPDQPVSAPLGDDDPRVAQFRDNVQQVSQGGRYFTWYGCGGCHDDRATGGRALADGDWRHGGTTAQIYASIAAHGALGARIPPEQLWQLAAYVVQLPVLDAALRRRQDADLAGEPRGAAWPGPVR